MKRPLLAAVLLFAAANRGPAQSITRLSAAPGDYIDEASATADGKRIYYTTASGDLWLYDRAASKSTRIGHLTDSWDLTVATKGQAIAFTKSGENGKDEYVWAIPLNVGTGLAAGPEHRVSVSQGDTPSISPDGRSVAFQRDDSSGALTIVPINGGPERVVIRMPHEGVGINVIRWTPDGKSLYYGLNTPRDHPEYPSKTMRVSVDGGTPTEVTTGGHAWPGLSPDGKFIVYRDTGVTERHVVADAAGKRVGTLDIPGSQDEYGWAGGSNLLIATSSPFSRVRSYSLDDGRSRIVIDSMATLQELSISPDGKQVSIVHRVQARSELLVANVDGTNRRHLPLAGLHNRGNVWSPDGHWLASHPGWPSNGVHAVDVLTGREVSLSPERAHGETYYPIDWLADSRRILFVDQGDSTGGATPSQRFALREGVLGGQPTTRRELVLARDGFVWPVGDSLLITRRTLGEATMIGPIEPKGPDAVLLPATPGFTSIPSFSSDGRWVAFRRNPAANDNNHLTLLEVVQIDGTHRTTITVPFSAAPGGDNPHFLPGDKQVILAEDASQSDSAGVYLVTLADKSIKRLFTLPRDRSRNFSQFAVTPDGKMILYLTTDRVPVSFGLLSVPSSKR